MFRGIGFWAAILVVLPAACTVVLGQSRAQSSGASKPAPPPFMIEAESYEDSQRVTKVVFKNGLTALIYESHAQPLVSIRTYVSGGFLNDPDEKTGLSEITARLRENIGEGRPTGTIRRRAQALGGVFHAGADPHFSSFEVTVPSARWRQALNVKADAMLTPFENNEAFRLNVGRLAENIRGASAYEGVRAKEELLALAFGERRFARYGQALNIAPEEIIEFHKNRYVPSAITVAVAGDVRAADVLNEIVRVFTSKNESAKNTASRAIGTAAGKTLAASDGFRYHAASVGAGFPKIFFGFHAPPENHEDYRALETASAILGIGETSILNTRLRDRKGLIFTARAQMESFGGAGFFSVELETESQNIDKAEIAFWTEVEILKRDGPTETELARALAQLERRWWERRETVGELADALAMSEFQGGWKRMDGYISEIRKVTAADVRRAITRHLTLSNCALLELLPASSAERNLTPAAALRTLESLLRPAMNEELNARVGEIEPNFKIPPAVAATRLNEVSHLFQQASILRGPEIYIREDHTSPILEMGFYFTGGKAQEGEANAGITELMLELMLRNERENRQLEIYGGSLTPVVTEDYFGFFLSIPARNSSGGLERIKQAVKSPVFDDTEFEKLKQSAAARLRYPAALDAGRRRLKEVLFRNHPYAAEGTATHTSLENISIETVIDWYEENVRNVKPFVAIVGDTEGTSLASWFTDEFSGSRMKERKEIVSLPKPVEKTDISVNDGGILYPEIALGFQAPSTGDMDVYGALILKNYLENHLSETEGDGEKNQERESINRRISLEYRALASGGNFAIYATVKAGEEAQGVESLRGKITRFISQPLHYADFHAARVFASGAYMTANQTRKAQIESLTGNLLAGVSLKEYHMVSWNIEQVGEDDFMELMRRIPDINKAVTVVVHGGDR